MCLGGITSSVFIHHNNMTKQKADCPESHVSILFSVYAVKLTEMYWQRIHSDNKYNETAPSVGSLAGELYNVAVQGWLIISVMWLYDGQLIPRCCPINSRQHCTADGNPTTSHHVASLNCHCAAVGEHNIDAALISDGHNRRWVITLIPPLSKHMLTYSTHTNYTAI